MTTENAKPKADSAESLSTAGLGAWLPIETAPKDGTRILLCFRRGDITIGFWHQPGNPKVPGFWSGYSVSTRYAEYWIPLPKAPNDQAKGPGGFSPGPA